MWIYRFTYCLLQGHAFVDITANRHPYRYCLHCGKVLEPVRREKAGQQDSQPEGQIY